MGETAISIIVPMYNVASFIARALESCINQSLKDIEIIVVDDNSSDESLKIAKEFAKSDKRIKIFQHQTNQGTFLARKTGIMNANAEIVIFLDGDDFLHLQACELIYRSVLNGGGGYGFILL